jgi:hypothetical protein
MSSYYYPMPGYRVPGPLNFEPVTNALMQVSQNRWRQEQLEKDDKRLALEDQRWRTTDARAQQQFNLQKRKAELEEQGLPQERVLRQAQIDLAQAQARSAGQKNVLESAIADIITGSAGVSEAPPPHSTPGSSNLQGGPNPGVIPQSYGGERAPSRNFLMDVYSGGQTERPPPVHNALMPSQMQQYRPGVILAADDMPYADPNASEVRPPQQPRDQQSGPMSGMTPRQRQAFALGLAGKGEAGRILMDVENQHRLDKTAQGEVDKKEIEATNSLAKLNEIRSSFDPSFLTYQGQVRGWGQALVDKAGYLKPEDQAQLYRFATFRRDAEFARNLVDLPNAGTGMLDGDSPTEFKAKLDRGVETLTLAAARYRFLRQRGFTGAPWEGMSLEQMRATINRRADEIKGELKRQNPNASPAMLEQESDLRVRREFQI